MTPITYTNSDSYAVAILIKQSSFNRQAIDSNYVVPLVEQGLDKSEFIAYPLAYNDAKKAPVKFIKQVLDDMLPEFLDNKIRYLYCADAAYFKALTGMQQADKNLGYCLPCKYAGYEKMQVVLGVNHTSLIYNPLNENKLNLSLKALVAAVLRIGAQFEKSIITNGNYPYTLSKIKQALQQLHTYPVLAVDIETFSLDHDKAGLGTIAFSWNISEGIAFAIDYVPITEKDGVCGKRVYNAPIRALLREFLDTYQGQISFHKANFDIKVLIYELYMADLADTAGLLTGLHTLTRDFDDTRIIAYLALNSCAGNELSLKVLAHEYAGNYAQDDIKDITRISYAALLEYNLVDACCTNWVHEKYWPVLLADDQEEIYFDIMLPSLKTIIQMELTGMPLNPQRVQEVKEKLTIIRTGHELVFRAHPVIQLVEELNKKATYDHDYQLRVDKAKNPDKIMVRDYDTFPTKPFNASSNKQLQILLYDVLKLPIIEKTKTGQPATGGDVLEKLANHVKDDSVKDLFTALIGYSSADKILSTFIVAFEKAIKHSPEDPRVYLHGSFNLGGTKSGRLSSSDPNLTNIPATSTHGKLVKSCFQAWVKHLFVGADFHSLEAMINALTTKDPNKLTVYENGLDSHSWNAFGYWPDKMPDVAARMDKSYLQGKFYKRELSDGSFEYLHESELQP